MTTSAAPGPDSGVTAPQAAEPAAIPVTATPPSFDPAVRRVTLPNLVGVAHLIDGAERSGSYLAPGTGPRPLRVTAVARSGYRLLGDAAWSATVGGPHAPGAELAAEDFRGPAGWLVPEDGPRVGARREGPPLSRPGAVPMRWSGWGQAPSLVRDGSGTAGAPPGTGWVTAQHTDPGLEDVSVEVEVAALPAPGGRAVLQLRFGVEAEDPDPFRERGFRLEVRWPPVDEATGREEVAVQPGNRLWFTRRAGTEGRWTFTRIGRTVTVAAPDGRVAGWNREAEPGRWGTGIVLSLPAGADPAFRLGGIRIRAARP